VAAYGVLAIVAITIGLAGLLDLGLGGAGLRSLAADVDRGDLVAARRTIGTILTVYAAVGVIGVVVIGVAGPLVLTRVLGVPATLEPEARIAFLLAALGFPLTLVAGALASVARAAQRFDISVRVAVATAVISGAATAAAVLLGLGLIGVVVATIVANAFSCLINLVAARHVLGGPITFGLDTRILRDLAGFAGWFVVSSVGVAILYQLDRYLVGAVLGVGSVTYYVVPGNLAARIQGLLGAAGYVVFPASASLVSRHDPERLRRLYRESTRLLFVLGTSVAVPLAAFAHPFLAGWIGPEFADTSAPLMSVLAGTYLLLGLTSVAWGLAFGAGRARANAMFAVGMAVLDVALFFVLVGPLGTLGAAVAFLLSAAIGAPALIVYVERAICRLSGVEFLVQFARVVPAVALQAVLAVALASAVSGLPMTLTAMAVTAAALPLLYLLSGLAPQRDRELLLHLIVPGRRGATGEAPPGDRDRCGGP
jgi:O-antigen/teichoic acid export membrane protein